MGDFSRCLLPPGGSDELLRGLAVRYANYLPNLNVVLEAVLCSLFSTPPLQQDNGNRQHPRALVTFCDKRLPGCPGLIACCRPVQLRGLPALLAALQAHEAEPAAAGSTLDILAARIVHDEGVAFGTGTEEGAAKDAALSVCHRVTAEERRHQLAGAVAAALGGSIPGGSPGAEAGAAEAVGTGARSALDVLQGVPCAVQARLESASA